jgi:hypothetical protein
MSELQTTLWDAGPTLARARHDAPTSQQAADRMNKSGAAPTQAEIVLAAIKDIPGRTSAELSRDTGLDRHAVASRCADLKKAGRLRHGEAKVCSVNKTSGVTWFPIY